MSQPDFDNIKSKIDLAVVWYQKTKVSASGITTETTLKFGYKRCFLKEKSEWVYDLSLTAAGPVNLGGQYYDNLISLGTLRQGFTPGMSSKFRETTQTLTIARTGGDIDDDGNPLPGYQYIGAHGITWDHIKQLRGDLVESDSAISIIGLFLFEKGTTIDPDTDLIFTGYVDIDSFNFKDGRLELKVTDLLTTYNRPILKKVVNQIVNAPLPPELKGYVPLVFGSFDFKNNPAPGWEGMYRFIKLVPDSLQTIPSVYGSLTAGGAVSVNTGIYTDNLVYHWYEGSLQTVHTVSKIGDDGIFIDNINHPTGTKVFQKAPPAVDFDEASFDSGHEWYMIMHNVAGHGASTVPWIPNRNPADIWYIILNNYANVPTSLIGDKYLDARAVFSANPDAATTCRRIITEQINTFDLLNELCEAFGMATVVINGKFELILTPMWLDREVDFTICPKDILRVGGKSSLEISSDPGKDRIKRDQDISFFYDHDQGFQPSVDDQAAIQSIMPVIPNPPGLIPNEATHEGGFFRGGNALKGADEVKYKWVYWRMAAIDLLARQQAYRRGKSAGALRGGKVTVVKRFLGKERNVGDIICIKDKTLNGNTVINALIYSTSTNFNNYTTTLLFEEVSLEDYFA